MKVFLFCQAILFLACGLHRTTAQSVTMHESYSFYYGTQGPYSCEPNPNAPVSVNRTYSVSNTSRWLGGYNPASGGRPAYYEPSNREGYLVNQGVCVYCYSPFTIWWNGVGWVLGYQGTIYGPPTYTNSIALFNGLNTAKPPCKGWGHGYLTGDCINAAVTVSTPEGAPDINAGDIVSIGTLNDKNAYEMPVTNASAGAKVIIFYDGSKWVVTYQDPSARTEAETILSSNSTVDGSNPPCTGWSNGYSFAGAICEGGATGTLPVTLIAFEAEPTPQKTVKLTWATAQEQNSLYYGIERSKDMRTFEQIARVGGAGTTNRTSSYAHTDEAPLKGRSYYRLQQVDDDGQKTPSKWVSVRLSGTDAPYPNPSRNGTIQIEAGDAARLRLTDVHGNDIAFVRKRVNGEVTELVPRQRLQPGVYVVENDGMSFKVVVE